MAEADIKAERADAGGVDICLVVPPFSSIHYPHLGTAVLKRACEERGLSTRIVYGNVMLAGAVGLEAYDAVAEAQMRVMLGDRLFRDTAYPPETAARLPALLPLPKEMQAAFDRVSPAISPALDAIVAEVLACRPRIVGLSSTFQQNLACASLARRVRAAAPETCIVMGGANAVWPICNGLARAFPWIDHFFAGESDIDFPQFCEQLLRRGENGADRVVRSEPIRDMRVVSPPEYDDFFAALRPLQQAGRLPDWLPRYLMSESSRGCWWGAKSHCTFCGLNGEGMDFRNKSADRVRAELEALVPWGIENIFMADNIMPHGFHRDLLPELAEAELPVKLFYEIKANLSEAQVDTMVAGGIATIQPGIESLSSPVLKLMRKGVSSHQNIALLRHARGAVLNVLWGIIYGFPGERAADYEAMIAVMPRIAHLQRPNGAHRIVVDRFSPFYKDPVGLGIGRITPFEAYRALYPPEIDTTEVAYHFDGHYSTDLLGDEDLLARFKAAVEGWQQAWVGKEPVLELFERGGRAFVLDTRPIARRTLTPLSAEQHEALRLLDHPLAWDRIPEALVVHAEWLVAEDFVIDHEGRLMSVVVRQRVAAGAGVDPRTKVEA